MLIQQSCSFFNLCSCSCLPWTAPRLCCRTPEPVKFPTPLHLRLHFPIFPISGSFQSGASPSSTGHGALGTVWSTWSTTERNKEMTVHGEDDSRDPPASWQYASKCLYITSPKNMVPPNGWTSGANAIVNVVNKRENYTTSGWHQGPSRSRIFLRNKQLLFILVLAMDQGNNGAVTRLARVLFMFTTSWAQLCFFLAENG